MALVDAPQSAAADRGARVVVGHEERADVGGRGRRPRLGVVGAVALGDLEALGGAQDDVGGLVDAWSSLRGNRDAYRDKPLGVVGGLLGANSLYDPSPIRARIRAFADDAKLRATGKKLLLGVVSLTTGAFRVVDERTPGIANWVYASSAIPVFFPPLRTRGPDGAEEQWVDGGVRDVTPLGSALAQNPRAVLVVMASPLAPEAARSRDYGSIVSIALRSVGILHSEVMTNDTSQAALINDLIAARAAQARALTAAGVRGAAAAAVLAPLDARLAQYRFAPIRIIAPTREYSDTLEFDPVKIRAAMEAGRQAVSADWTALEAFVR